VNSNARSLGAAVGRLGGMLRDRVLHQTLRYRRPLIFAVHAGLFVLANVLAFSLRFDLQPPRAELARMLVTLPFLLGLRFAAFWRWHLYQGLWRYVSVRDGVEILKAVSASTLAFAAAVALLSPGYPRSVLVIDWFLCLGAVAGMRLVWRLYLEHREPKSGKTRCRAIVVGAGDVAEALLREINRGALPYSVAGLVTDDPSLRGRRLQGIRVIGSIDDLPALCGTHDVAEVLIASPNGANGDRPRIAAHCRDAGVVLRTVPTMSELLQGRAAIAQLRKVDDEELLGRGRIGTEVERLRHELSGRRVLVTGAAGSIGSELARQIAAFDPEVLVLYDRAESDLYLIYVELTERFPDVKIEAVVGDILDKARVDHVMIDHSPQLVYHAAAYKHVPLMEAHPIEGIKNNVLGTDIVARSAIEHGVKEFVLISTDKAVRPVGIMGMTKRAAEFVIRSLAGQGTTFVAVRFGNVLGSNGSVLPLFQKQIASGSPVTVTDPEALRYFMLTSEAVELVLTAGALGNDGEVYVLHTGEPIRIGDLAENFIRLSGFEPDVDVPIQVTGLRPGERMVEEFWWDSAEVEPGPHEKIRVVRERNFDVLAFLSAFEMLASFVDAGKVETSVALLRTITTSDQVSKRPQAFNAPEGQLA
jgi:FlaA1/EpsC-like NDP-sugar epimerase